MIKVITILFNNYANRKNVPKAKADYENSLTSMDDILTKQADYVDEMNAGGNKTIIESSGFKSANDISSKKPVPGVPVIKNENEELSLSIN